jgi:hypothetical protein
MKPDFSLSDGFAIRAEPYLTQVDVPGYMTAVGMTTDGTEPSIELEDIVRTNDGTNSNSSPQSTQSAKNPIKKSSVIEPFKEINDAISDMEREINRASKAADRLWGDARIKAIEKENNAIR